PYQAFWFWNRTRREINFVSTGILGGAAMVACPFLDPDFVRLGLSLPWSVTSDQKLHDDAITRAYPAFSDIPYAEGFRSIPSPRIRLDRLRNGLDSLRVAAMARPGVAAVNAMLMTLSKGPLWRARADIYRVHKDFVDRMDANEARRLIALRDFLDQTATKGKGLVSDVFPGS
ncbi:MAG TPA: hypothetical protein PKA03_14005, partial [Tabrizicola sp.]|nr:hypothetical protein [Tabrizicola sp.]